MDCPVNMWAVFATVTLIASAALGKDVICKKRIYEACDYDYDFAFPTNEKEFDETCVILLEETDCRQDYAIKCESEHLEHITAMTDFLHDVCRKGSSLNEAIRPNMGCIIESVMKECSESPRRVHRTYREYLNATGEEYVEEATTKLICMILAYDVTCTVNAVSMHCGSTVKDAVKQSLRRIDWMEHKTRCPRSVREEIAKDIPIIGISIAEKVILEELLFDI